MSTVIYYGKVLFWFIPVIAWRFSGDSLFLAIKLALQLWWFVLSRKVSGNNQASNFTCVYKGNRFTLTLEQPMDVAALAEVFVAQEYQWDVDGTIKTILDLGAHWGDTAIFYAANHPTATVYAVEPSNQSFLRLEKLSGQFANIVPYHAALSKADEELSLFTSGNSLGNSLHKRADGDTREVVSGYTLSSLAVKLGVTNFDLIKFDIEGAEECLFNDNRTLELASRFIGEIHLDLMDMTLSDIKKFFSGFQVEFTRLSDQRYILRAWKNSYV